MKEVKPVAQRIGLVLFTLCGVCGSKCTAASLVLHGTATVATAASVLNPDLISYTPLPLNVSVGDVFSFKLSINTTLAPTSPPGYQATFSAVIGGADVVDAGVVVQVFDDSLIYSRNVAEIIPIDSVGALGDQISSYIFGSSGHILSMHASAFQTNLLFTSSLSYEPPFSSLLTNTHVPGDTSTWQSFSQRELALSFDNRTYLGAYITTITVVPEPATVAILLNAVFALLANSISGRERATTV